VAAERANMIIRESMRGMLETRIRIAMKKTLHSARRVHFSPLATVG